MSSQRQAVEGVPGPRQSKKQLEVLDVASDYFLSHGYKGTSINAMARDSGISKESIYRYFSSKKELFEAVIAKELAEYREKLQFLDYETESIALDTALKRTAETLLGVVLTDRTLSLRRLIFQQARQSPDIGQYYYKIGPQAAYTNLEKIFAAHRDETDFAPESLPHYFIGMVLHRSTLQRECGVSKPLSKARIRTQAAETTEDFLRAFFK
ncbi:MAG TPA: TetR/AcrR family transcriptional regulator [Woeseiaceae bacterium]|nr:TetR/AcrR family transcriptional regulator [Woeseiaceae bacterium]